MEHTVDIALSGGTLPGHEPTQVSAALAALLKLDDARAATLLSGRETVIKRGLPASQVERYLQAIHATGAATRVQPIVPAPETVAVAFPAIDDDAPSLQTSSFPAIDVAAEAPPHESPVILREAAPATEPAAVAVPAEPAMLELALVEPAPVETVCCPVCKFEQPKRTLCRQCGADMPRVLAAQSQPTAPEAQVEGPQSVSLYNRNHPLQSGNNFAWVDETPDLFAWNVKGRLGRARYMAYSLLLTLAVLGSFFVGGMLLGLTGSKVAAFLLIGPVGLVGVLQALRLMTLRLHDMNRSGAWILMALLFVFFLGSRLMVLSGGVGSANLLGAMAHSAVNMIVSIVFGLGSLVLMAWPGTGGSNDFGAPPDAGEGLVQIGAFGYVLLLFWMPYYGASHMPANAAPQPSTMDGKDIGDAPEDKEPDYGAMIDKGAEMRGITLTPSQREAAIAELREQWQAQKRRNANIPRVSPSSDTDR